MTYVKVKGFQIYQDRHGTWRCYHRKSRTPIDLAAHPIGSAGFFAECERLASHPAREPLPPRPGTLGKLIAEYRGHDDFLTLSKRTRRDYQRCFDYLKSIDDTPLVVFTPALVVGIRDKAGQDLGRKWGTYVKTTLSLLFSWGRERGYLDTNPAFRVKGLKRPKDAPDANRPWSDAERHAVIDGAPDLLRLPLSLMMFCGLDPGDITSLPKTAVRDGYIDARRAKTKEPIWIPLPEPVKQALADAARHDAMTLCANSQGSPWTYSGLDGAWQRYRAQLLRAERIAPGLTLKGLRHTVATILAEMGYDARTIADLLGQKTTAMGEHYSRRANKTKKLTAVVKNFDDELNKRRSKSV